MNSEAAFSALPDLPVLTCNFLAQAEGELDLPVFSGSTFRGNLGWVLMRVACARRGQCPPCQSEDCVYRELFEARGVYQGVESEVPRPFVLLLPGKRGRLRSGTRFQIGFRLFGAAVDRVGIMVHCLEALGKEGVGPERGRFRLLSGQVESPHAAVVFFRDGSLVREPESVSLSEFAGEPISGVRKLTIRLLTPTRIVFRGQVLDKPPPFDVWVRALLRRLDLMFRFWAGAGLQVDYKALVAAAQGIQLSRASVSWVDYRRYSNRQERSVQTGGQIGTVSYQGELDQFLPWLALGTVLHVGKATTFGMGRFRVHIPIGV